MTEEQEALFLAARESVGRNAYAQHLREDIDDNSNEHAIHAAERFRNLQLLHDPRLLDLALHTLSESRGHVVDGSEPFPSMLWLGGATATYDGRTFSGNLLQFVRLLQDRARVYAPKRSGWVIEPVTNIDGHRTNASTKKMHALFLDCDGTGHWDDLLGVLNEFNFCYVAYQSGGWSPSTPKWRVVIPLHVPHTTHTEAGQVAWKAIYNHARVVFGACGRLRGVGFDPATETPCCPWFLTEKRDPSDPERKIIFRRPGHTLDLAALMIALPEVVVEERTQRSAAVVTKLTLDEARMNQIIDVLAQATNRVPSGRRDLYLALPGVLLDRGVPPDDVYAIIEAVSASYPRPHADKHADNLHNARTTITKWESGERYTRIGTLNSTAPTVAAALDLVLPDPAQKAIVDVVEQLLNQTTNTHINGSQTSPPSPPTSSSPSSPQLTKRRHKLSNFGRQVSPIANRLKASNQPMRRLAGLLLGCVLDGVPLPTTSTTTPSEVDGMVALVMHTLGRALPVSTRWQEALDFASHSLSLMDFTQSKERVAAAERAFYEGQGKRNKSNTKKAAVAADFKARSSAFFTSEKG